MNKLLPLFCLLLISCGGSKVKDCPHLRHTSGENINIVIDSMVTEVIINHPIHSLEHLNIEGMLPCRYRVSWIGINGGNQDKLIQDKDVIR
jgi:hypothetical protein